MTGTTFRRLALALADTTEGSHHGHADFRTSGRVFATAGYPDKRHGMVKLSTAEQAELVRLHPSAFVAAPGAWGAKGATLVVLSAASQASTKQALALAHRHLWREPRRPKGI